MAKRLALLVGMIFICWFGLAGEIYGAEKGELTLEVHYIRYNEDYGGWDLWLWTDTQEGRSYPFEVCEDGVLAQIRLGQIDDTSQIGIIVRKGNWEEKDVDEDRFLDISQAKDGKLSVWIWQGESTIHYEKVEADVRIMDAGLESEQEVTFQAYLASEAEFRVTDQDGREYPWEIRRMNRDGNMVSGSLTLREKVSLPGTFYLSIGEAKKSIRFGRIYDTDTFRENFVYDGDDLGAIYTEEECSFRLWSPMAEEVTLLLYEEGTGGEAILTEPMSLGEKGVWQSQLQGDYAGKYYTYLVNVQGSVHEVVDPYAKSVGVNGKRGMILSEDAGRPEGFENDSFLKDWKREDVILYEASVRDYTSDDDSGVLHKGKFLGLTEENTVNSAGDSTGLSYLAELGITHVHFLPIQDFCGVDEENPEETYNWGYNPLNYFVPEGSYATDPYHGEVRVQELKKMIQSLHEQKIGVVMDVVYNHTYYGGDSNFNHIVPGYYHRIDQAGNYSNGSACGNELATERAMVRKLIIDSVKYWMQEYHVDGFRFDLMGLIDVETMKEIEKEVYRINPHAVLYGEGWDAGETIYEEPRMESFNAYLTPEIGTFNNVFRRAVQKHVCGLTEEEDVILGMRFGFAGAGDNPNTIKRMGKWTAEPLQCINYASCHDGYTLWDLITLNCPEEDQELLKRRDRFGAACVLLCQGTPFLHSGEEFLRTKASPDNPDAKHGASYNAGDEINTIDWENRTENKDVLEYYRGLMLFRKEHKALGYGTQSELNENLLFIEDLPENVMGYYAKEPVNFFTDYQICLMFNPTREAVEFLPVSGKWEIYVNDDRAGTECLEVVEKDEALRVEGVSALAAVRTVVRIDRIVIMAVLILFLLAVIPIITKMKKKKA